MGAILHIPIYRGDLSKFNDFIQSHNLNVYVADANGQSIEKLDIQAPIALVLGNEANGSDLKNEKKYKQNLNTYRKCRFFKCRHCRQPFNVSVKGGFMKGDIDEYSGGFKEPFKRKKTDPQCNSV